MSGALFIYLYFVILAVIAVAYLAVSGRISVNPSSIILILIFLLLPPGIFKAINYYSSSLPEVTTPDLYGIPLSEALGRLQALEIKGEMAAESYDRTVPKGNILSQRPEAGRKVKIGRKVQLVVSKGPRSVIIPDLIGRPSVQAKEMLEVSGLRLGNEEKDYESSYQEGTIVRQDPVPGTEADFASTVNIIVAASLESSGKERDEE